MDRLSKGLVLAAICSVALASVSPRAANAQIEGEATGWGWCSTCEGDRGPDHDFTHGAGSNGGSEGGGGGGVGLGSSLESDFRADFLQTWKETIAEVKNWRPDEEPQASSGDAIRLGNALDALPAPRPNSPNLIRDARVLAKIFSAARPRNADAEVIYIKKSAPAVEAHRAPPETSALETPEARIRAAPRYVLQESSYRWDAQRSLLTPRGFKIQDVEAPKVPFPSEFVDEPPEGDGRSEFASFMLAVKAKGKEEATGFVESMILERVPGESLRRMIKANKAALAGADSLRELSGEIVVTLSHGTPQAVHVVSKKVWKRFFGTGEQVIDEATGGTPVGSLEEKSSSMLQRLRKHPWFGGSATPESE